MRRAPMLKLVVDNKPSRITALGSRRFDLDALDVVNAGVTR